jgi:hypothetical protein
VYVLVFLGTPSFRCAVKKLIISGCLGSTCRRRFAICLVIFVNGSARLIHSLIFFLFLLPTIVQVCDRVPDLRGAFLLFVEILHFGLQYCSFLGCFVLLVSAVLVIVAVFPHLEEAVPHCGYYGCCPPMRVGLFHFFPDVMLLLYFVPLGQKTSLVEVGPSDFILLLERLFYYT